MILALASQNMDIPQAAITAVFLHGKAGDKAKGSKSILSASDIIEQISRH